MYSKKENQQLKQDFWIAFSEKYPKKWILYDTKIKDFSFKFYADNKKAQVILDIENKNISKREAYFDKLKSLQTILETEFLPDLIFEKEFHLENGKCVSRIWTEQSGVSLGNKNTWEGIFDFFFNKMNAFELFYFEYDEYIKNIEV